MSCSGTNQDDDECCPITLVPFRTITSARTTFLPCCHRFDSDAIRHYIDQCLMRARAGRATVATSVPCPVCRCRVPPDYLADMGVPVVWPPRTPVAPPPATTPAPAAQQPPSPVTVAGDTRRSTRPVRPVAPPVVIVISDDGNNDDSEEMHERTAQWINSDDDDEDDEDEDDSTGSLDDFIVDDDHVDPDEDYVPRATPTSTQPRQAAVPDSDDSGSSDDDDDCYSDDLDDDSDCSCSTDEQEI
ncbi:Ring incomplete domain containing protein [Pandoravirus macleodensis]|uniref:Ring incomplete domain containing protein n=1 Tax=Pandoravirus macleodensis TaxID=2107707 RepID=A0A2U7UF30_9VIRU|nr:Ring incomplete domain containing protein [Pandoravirus macleodensis]AVK77078.1 Ring incomplete domain containing protein [Pandoravirus macleodensis]